jgi:hypothetical protein
VSSRSFGVEKRVKTQGGRRRHVGSRVQQTDIRDRPSGGGGPRDVSPIGRKPDSEKSRQIDGQRKVRAK